MADSVPACRARAPATGGVPVRECFVRHRAPPGHKSPRAPEAKVQGCESDMTSLFVESFRQSQTTVHNCVESLYDRGAVGGLRHAECKDGDGIIATIGFSGLKRSSKFKADIGRRSRTSLGRGL